MDLAFEQSHQGCRPVKHNLDHGVDDGEPFRPLPNCTQPADKRRDPVWCCIHAGKSLRTGHSAPSPSQVPRHVSSPCSSSWIISKGLWHAFKASSHEEASDFSPRPSLHSILVRLSTLYETNPRKRGATIPEQWECSPLGRPRLYGSFVGSADCFKCGNKIGHEIKAISTRLPQHLVLGEGKGAHDRMVPGSFGDPRINYRTVFDRHRAAYYRWQGAVAYENHYHFWVFWKLNRDVTLKHDALGNSAVGRTPMSNSVAGLYWRGQCYHFD